MKSVTLKKQNSFSWICKQDNAYQVEKIDGKYYTYHGFRRIRTCKTLREARHAILYHQDPTIIALINLVVS